MTYQGSTVLSTSTWHDRVVAVRALLERVVRGNAWRMAQRKTASDG
jgi:hypothetical protein